MNEIYRANVNERYKSLYSIYLGKKILKEGLLEAGQVTVVADYEPPIDKNEDTSLVLTCGLNANNSILSGLKKLYTLGVLRALHQHVWVASPPFFVDIRLN